MNHLRIGEGILLGRETSRRTAWPETFQDAFCLYAEVIEHKAKPAVPIGVTSQDAFGRHPTCADTGQRDRAILGASNDHLRVDVSAAADTMQVGDEVACALNDSARLAAMTAPYVDKRCLPTITNPREGRRHD